MALTVMTLFVPCVAKSDVSRHVFECDQTEMAVERALARAILVDVE